MEEPKTRERYLKRQGMVEPVFSQLKCRQGLRRFRRKGLKAVRCEFALHAMAYNLSRAMALWAQGTIVIFCWLFFALMSSIQQGKAHIFSKESLCRPMPSNI